MVISGAPNGFTARGAINLREARDHSAAELGPDRSPHAGARRRGITHGSAPGGRRGSVAIFSAGSGASSAVGRCF